MMKNKSKSKSQNEKNEKLSTNNQENTLNSPSSEPSNQIPNSFNETEYHTQNLNTKQSSQRSSNANNQSNNRYSRGSSNPEIQENPENEHVLTDDVCPSPTIEHRQPVMNIPSKKPNILEYNDENEEHEIQTKINANTVNTMDRISEVDNEDERYNTLFDKISDELKNKEEYKIDEKNIDELIGGSNIKNNVKEYFDPCLYNNTEDNRINKNRFKNYKGEGNSVNKSRDLSTGNRTITDPIELELYMDAKRRKDKMKEIDDNVS